MRDSLYHVEPFDDDRSTFRQRCRLFPLLDAPPPTLHPGHHYLNVMAADPIPRPNADRNNNPTLIWLVSVNVWVLVARGGNARGSIVRISHRGFGVWTAPKSKGSAACLISETQNVNNWKRLIGCCWYDNDIRIDCSEDVFDHMFIMLTANILIQCVDAALLTRSVIVPVWTTSAFTLLISIFVCYYRFSFCFCCRLR